MAAYVKIEYEGEDYQTISFEGNFSTLEVGSKDSQGDVLIDMEEDGDTHSVYIDQEGLKKLIAHLQKQVIQPNHCCFCGCLIDVKETSCEKCKKEIGKPTEPCNGQHG